MLEEYRPGMEAKGIAYSYTPAALKALVAQCEGGKFGARDLRPHHPQSGGGRSRHPHHRTASSPPAAA